MSVRCPRCGLINPSVAERCDCGYDFESKSVRESYLNPTERARRDLSGYVKALVAITFLSHLANLAGYGFPLASQLSIHFVWLSVAIVLYRGMKRGKQWARMLLAFWCFPIGLAFLTNRVKTYVFELGAS